jgi:hypothetical protein
MDHAHRHVVTPIALLVLGISVILGVSYGTSFSCPTTLTSLLSNGSALCPNAISIPTCPRPSSSFVVTFRSVKVHTWGVQSGCFHPTS